MQSVLAQIGGAAVPALFIGVLIYGLTRRVDVYGAFAEGAAEGLPVLVRILPYLAAMLIAVRTLRDSGLLAWLSEALGPITARVGLDGALLPLVLLRPFSGSGSMALVTEIFSRYGPDSPQGFAASVLMGSAETIFYEVALYFGAVGVKKTRYAVPVALAAGAVALIATVLLTSARYG